MPKKLTDLKEARLRNKSVHNSQSRRPVFFKQEEDPPQSKLQQARKHILEIQTTAVEDKKELAARINELDSLQIQNRSCVAAAPALLSRAIPDKDFLI